MAKLSLYLDENIQTALADALMTRGVDVLTTLEAENVGADDISLLAYAAENRRTMVSYNKRDFALLHYQWMKIGSCI
jgi:predicted nuclease of predicted toxin-antitoxin system